MLTFAAADTIQGVAGTATAITYTFDGMEYSTGTTPNEIYKVPAQGQMAISAGVLYTVPASTVAFISCIMLVNTTGTLVSGIILYRGGTAASNQITGSFSIPGNGRATIDENGELTVTDNLGNAYVAAASSTAAGASITSASAAINTSETQIVAVTIPANTLQAGTTWAFKLAGTCTSSAANLSTFTVRCGTAGSNSDLSLFTVTCTAATSGTAIAFVMQGFVTVRSAGASITLEGGGYVVNTGITGISSTGVGGGLGGGATVNTTVQNILQVTYKSAVSTTTSTFQAAEITLDKA